MASEQTKRKKMLMLKSSDKDRGKCDSEMMKFRKKRRKPERNKLDEDRMDESDMVKAKL
jgi:hypothetical protein